MADTQPPPADNPPPEPVADVDRLRAGIAALQGGDRPTAYAIFSELVGRAHHDVNTWLGLALSSDSPSEAFGALRQARLVQPENPFLPNAAEEVARRWPDYVEPPPGLEIEALPAGRTGEVDREPLTAAIPLPGDALSDHERAEAETETPEAETAGGARLAGGPGPTVPPRPAARSNNLVRLLAVLGLGLLFLLIIAGLGSGVLTTGLFRPPDPTITPTPLPTLPPPVVQVPPPVVPPTPLPPTPPGPPPTLSPGAGEGIRQTALQAVAEGRYSQAIPLLEQLAAANPQDTAAQYALGVAYLSGDRPNGAAEALLAFRSVTAQQPGWPPGQRMLAEALLAQVPPQAREAVAPARRAVELDSTRPESWLTLARAYEGVGDPANATLAYNEAARYSPAPPPAPPTVPPTATLTPVPTATATDTPVPVPSGAPEMGTPTPVETGTPGSGTTAPVGTTTAAAGTPGLPTTGTPASASPGPQTTATPASVITTGPATPSPAPTGTRAPSTPGAPITRGPSPPPGTAATPGTTATP